jgi:hypothetical protein
VEHHEHLHRTSPVAANLDWLLTTNSATTLMASHYSQVAANLDWLLTMNSATTLMVSHYSQVAANLDWLLAFAIHSC